MLQLRLVNATFDQEVLAALFSDRRPQGRARFMHGSNYHTAPPTLQQKYLRFRLRLHVTEPSLFAYLFLPVLERRLADLGISPDEEDRREAVLDELLRFVMHGEEAGWVVAHKSQNLHALLRRAFPMRSDPAAEASNEDTEQKDETRIPVAQRERQVEKDYQYTRVCRAILDDDPGLASRFVQESNPDVNRTSLCFGTTILNVFISRGSIRTIRTLLVNKPSVISAQRHQYEIFALASQRSHSAKETVTLLLEPSMAIRYAYRK
ncbi:hypothetical protein K458DRAFT_395941 [Lentithecium fluviatile CBS 122367]|uniref:Uncharacterized protein n=1 Tax=Lentithecium fluviatile CBS 122367 TaxID=1168545 RepID=A0A6G1IHI2_9PLEO|nr:hypothetical protein K458DRAFT_395941 [Lentithecium fluviatile CBS 122367]